MTSETVLVWSIAGGTIGGIVFRPRNWPEAVWACLGAGLLVVCGLLPVRSALAAVAKGADVYFFLAGMMLLAEVARREGVFDWLAALAVKMARGSGLRLFALVYGVGTLVTVCLSNDATAVVLTPAVYAAVKRARADALSYLFVCAFIANAASFVLPISNPANLVVFGKTLPALLPWLRTFLLPSVISIVATYVALGWTQRAAIRNEIGSLVEAPELSREGKRAGRGIVASGGALIAASAFGLNLGLPTCGAAVITVLFTTRVRGRALREILSGVSWSVLALVGGLFVMVEALDRAGALDLLSHLLRLVSAMPRAAGGMAAAFGIAALSNVMNNLPSGLLAGSVLQTAKVDGWIRNALLVGVDLGPNLSVTGSLATVLWLIALRREGVRIGAWRFLRVGIVVMPPALVLSVLAISLISR